MRIIRGDEMILIINPDSHNNVQIVFQTILSHLTSNLFVEHIGEVTDD